MEKHFGEEHKKATGQKISKGGYPDSGSGRYSQKLPYADWLKFNYGQRVHYNFLENLTQICLVILISGLYNTKFATIIGCVYFVGRLLYALGYHIGGAFNAIRIVGAVSCSLSMFIGFGTTLYWMYPGLKESILKGW